MGTAEATGNPEETPQTDSADLTPISAEASARLDVLKTAYSAQASEALRGRKPFPRRILRASMP